MKIKIFTLLLISVIWSTFCFAESKSFTIGSGIEDGVYYQAANSICRLVNKDMINNNLRCIVKNTKGSNENLNLLSNGQIEFAIIQGDYLKENLANLSKIKSQEVATLISEDLTILVKYDSDIKDIGNLASKRIYAGDDSSASRSSFNRYLSVVNPSLSQTISYVAESEVKSIANDFCQGKVDVIVMMVAHPNDIMTNFSRKCLTRIVPLNSESISKLIATYPIYRSESILGGTYNGSPFDSLTFGTRAILVASDKIDQNVVEIVKKSLRDNLMLLKDYYPGLQSIDIKVINNKQVIQ